MSIYETVKDELGSGPPYASRPSFTKHYGYAKGESLGLFATIDDAKTAGATTTEKHFDTDAFDAARFAYATHQQAIMDEWMKRLRAEYPEVNAAVFDLAYSLAYDRGHSAGYGEVELYLSDYIDFAVQVIAKSK